MMEKIFHEQARDLPVADIYDVIVAGSGPAGVAAALAVKKGVTPREITAAEIQAELV